MKNSLFLHNPLGMIFGIFSMDSSRLLRASNKAIHSQTAHFLFVFFMYVAAAKFGQHIYHFYGGQNSLALIWPATGLALAAVLIGGYRMWLPIMLAQFLVIVTDPMIHLSPLLVIVSTIVFTLQPLVGAYVLKRYFGFQGAMTHVRDALALIVLAFIIPAFAPFITTGLQVMTGEITIPPWFMWSRLWAGGVLSIMVITPLITTWFGKGRILYTSRHVAERVLTLLAMVAAIYMLFWTSLPAQNLFVALDIFFIPLFWIGFRMGPRTLSLVIFLTTAFGMAGSIIAHPSAAPLSQRLFADELFMILIAPIFLILATLMEECRFAVKELKEKNIELGEALTKTRFEDQAKSEFLAILGHELRNPLAPIVTTLELLSVEETNPDRIALISQAQKQTKIMRRLLDDLLDVSRVAHKKFNLKREPIILQTVLDQSIASIGAFMETQGVTLSVSVPKEPLWMYGDTARLAQVFNNVLHNAGNYTPRHGKVALIVTHEDNQAVIKVTDTGMGIDPSIIDSIFESFVSISSISQVRTGLGIGLSLVKRLTELHGGTVEAQSEGPGFGSTFTVRLPLLEPESVPATHLVESAKEEIMPTKFKILLVDDNEVAAQGLGKLLEHRGHTVLLRYTGKSALEAILSFQPDVVLLDIGLPDITGYEVAEQVRAQPKAARPILVALTGYGQAQDKRETSKAGMAYHLTKPVGIADIEAVLGRINAKRETAKSS